MFQILKLTYGKVTGHETFVPFKSVSQWIVNLVSSFLHLLEHNFGITEKNESASCIHFKTIWPLNF